MNLFINYYDAGVRSKELELCLSNNLKNSSIKRVVIFHESGNIQPHKKIEVIPTDKRPTYQDFFNLTKEYGADDINIISNADLYFDDTIDLVRNMSHRKCYAITRHELIKDEVIDFSSANNCDAKFSQDVWIFKGPVNMVDCDTITAINNRTKQYHEIPFTMGVPGCDNVIAAKLKDKYQVMNPYDQIKCVHVHKANSRNHYEYRITGAKTNWGIIRRGILHKSGL